MPRVVRFVIHLARYCAVIRTWHIPVEIKFTKNFDKDLISETRTLWIEKEFSFMKEGSKVCNFGDRNIDLIGSIC